MPYFLSVVPLRRFASFSVGLVTLGYRWCVPLTEQCVFAVAMGISLSLGDAEGKGT
ncbi:hypothetical protein NT01EI_1791 [Edwardsiella ictaluri 93-146]|uniref:Uncharacterized protein n=1 Tax=Edwardsiella ictaluri (strain 93-146) TaxID=634503 RepID=C5BFK5_EDWI9|nr:hypothetical protein NT01EI_1791 [Edwardsiella ictaluri 93-146]